MNAQSAYATVLGRKCCIDFGQYGWVEGFSTVYDSELQPHVIRDGFNGHIAPCALWVSILHDINHSLFDGKLHLHGDDGFQSDCFAHLSNEVVQPRHFRRVVGKDQTLTKFDVSLLANVLYGHHGQVIALLGITDKLVDCFGHLADELLRFQMLLGKGLRGHIRHTFHLELRLISIHSFRQSVGEEEDGGTGKDLCLLKRIFPRWFEADRNVRVAGKHAHACTDEQRSIVASITVIQVPRWQVEHADKEGDEHTVLVHLGNNLVHGCHNAVGHRLANRYRAEDGSGDCHEERGRNAFAGNVANAEEEFLVAEVEVEQVATYILGRCQRGIYLYVVAVGFGGKLLGQHALLYGACDADVSFY